MGLNSSRNKKSTTSGKQKRHGLFCVPPREVFSHWQLVKYKDGHRFVPIYRKTTSGKTSRTIQKPEKHRQDRQNLNRRNAICLEIERKIPASDESKAVSLRKERKALIVKHNRSRIEDAIRRKSKLQEERNSRRKPSHLST